MGPQLSGPPADEHVVAKLVTLGMLFLAFPPATVVAIILFSAAVKRWSDERKWS